MSFRALAALSLALCATPVAAQYGSLVEGAAGGEGPTVGACILIVGAAAGSLEPEVRIDEARAALAKLGCRLPRAADDSRISYADFAYLVAQLYDLPGGFAYRAFPGPRTAFEEAARLGLLPPGAKPDGVLSGADLLFILRKLEARGGGTP
jgi:hypothetical protein